MRYRGRASTTSLKENTRFPAVHLYDVRTKSKSLVSCEVTNTQLLVVSYLLTTSRVWLAVHFPVICTKMSSFPFYQIGCIIRRVQFKHFLNKHIRFQVVKLSVWFTSGLQCVYCSFYIIYSGWKADSVAFVVSPCVYIRVYSTVVIKIYAKVLFAITFFQCCWSNASKEGLGSFYSDI